LLLNQNGARSALKVRIGLWLYQKMSGRKTARLGEMELKRIERALDAGRRWSLFSYEDAQCEFPERLVAEWLTEAIDAGASVRNHAEVLAVDVSHGRARGVLFRDRLTGKDQRVDANWILNCTGPWADRLCQRSSVRTKQPMVGGIRGSHLILPRFAGAPDAALYTEASDGRPVFVVPWNEQIMVGTTEVADDTDPARSAPSQDEIDYLLRTVTQLFPKARLNAASIKYAFAGVRPLPYSPSNSPSAVSRRHFLHDHTDEGAAHMISIIGGKLTTAASLARECARAVGLRPTETAPIAIGPDGDLDPLLNQATVEVAQAGSISEESARGIVEWHGKRAMDIARTALIGTELRAPICPHTAHIVAEVVEGYRKECAVTLGDILLRRVPVALGPCWSESCSREAALRIGAVLGWNEQTMGSNLEAFEIEREAFLHRPSSGASVLKAAAD
jgi:glycerol-3-phosphate dehydrogenase